MSKLNFKAYLKFGTDISGIPDYIFDSLPSLNENNEFRVEFDLDNPVSLDVNIDDKYSPAEVNELCCQYSSNLEGLLSFLNST